MRGCLSPQQLIDASREEARLNAGTNVLADKDVNAYLAGLIGRLIAHLPEAPPVAFRVRILQSSTPYAFCLDNGAIYLSTGLLARVQNEAQLATFIATELTPALYRQAQRRTDYRGAQSSTQGAGSGSSG